MDSKRIQKRDMVSALSKKIRERAAYDGSYKSLLNLSQSDLNSLLEAFEDTVFDYLKSATEDKSVVVPVFGGMTVEGFYVKGGKKKNNLNGKTIKVANKIKPKATFTRTCVDKLSYNL